MSGNSNNNQSFFRPAVEEENLLSQLSTLARQVAQMDKVNPTPPNTAARQLFANLSEALDRAHDTVENSLYSRVTL